MAYLGRLHSYLGDYARARDWLDQFLRVVSTVESPDIRLLGVLPLAMLSLHTGPAEQALTYAEQGLAAGPAFSHAYTQAHALVVVGHAQAGLNRLIEAAAAYQQALALFEELGNAALAAEPRAGLASVALAQGDQTRHWRRST